MKELHGNIEILSSREVGFVGVCHGCGHIQITIGTVISELSPQAFLNLKNAFERIYKDIENWIQRCPDGDRIILTSGNEHFHLYLTQEQFEQVITIFNEAYVELSLRQELDEILG